MANIILKHGNIHGNSLKNISINLPDAFIQSDLHVFSGYTIFFVSMCSLGIEPTTFARLTQCSTTEPQGLYVGPIHSIYNNINTF